MSPVSQNPLSEKPGKLNNMPSKQAAPAASVAAAAAVVDLRGSTALSNTDANLRSSIVNAFTAKNVQYNGRQIRSLPTMILYSARGLEIYDKITYLKEYYLMEAELHILAKHATDFVAKVVRNGSVLVELGCGAMRKTKHILEAIVAQGRTDVTYYAVDLSESSLRESLAPLCEAFPSIKFVGLLGCYEDSVDYITKTVPVTTPKTYLWLGSSIGNLDRPAAAAFLREICAKGMQPGDTFLCGIDRRNSGKDISLAYNDPSGVTRDFILEGLTHVNQIFGHRVFDRDRFEYLSEYQEHEGRHAAYYRSLQQQTISFREGKGSAVELEKGEIINVEYSYKWSAAEVDGLVETARLYNVGKWTDPKDMYDLHLFQKPPFFFPKNAPTQPVPSLAEYEQLWKAWDVITDTMIPKSAHLVRPISLRHPYIFYMGHIPAFLDIQLSRATDTPLTHPQNYAEIFERGIDPCIETGVVNPHSTVPDTWPAVADILAYKKQVRAKLRNVLADLEQGKEVSKRVKRVIWMCYEHEAMHIETLLYMLVQSDTTLPPAGFLEPLRASSTPQPPRLPRMVRFSPDAPVPTGLEDPEPLDFDASAPAPSVYGWDNEKPARTLPAPAPFEVSSQMVTIAEYAAFLDDGNRWANPDLIPASWGKLPTENGTSGAFPSSSSSSAHGVKTAFGIRPLATFASSPVALSYNQALQYAEVKGMRLPTEAELRCVRQAGRRLERHYGFSSWVPLGAPVGAEGNSIVVDEGLWEWTSTVFEKHDSYVASDVYPGYSSDFFDTKHNVVLGASWATLPRISERPSFVNWYQRAYPYVFAGFRLAKSV
ncbi:histidine-specific methyltransferase [Geranomyces variabilis]|nr:histidine-specific methyltransferase [Geranomyces variabilis]KAJ3142863.1 hypothetical protein HDU90_002734 [Geranomyces variabilis]